MEYSDSESGSASVSPVWENTHLRTSKSLSEASVPPSRQDCVPVDSSKATGALSQCQQDQAGGMLPPAQYRHLELPEQNVIPREVGGENLSETTDSEESADLLPEACEGPGAKCARVNLKRKLEHASESERSEKYLIRDVGNLQLGWNVLDLFFIVVFEAEEGVFQLLCVCIPLRPTAWCGSIYTSCLTTN